MDIRKEIKLLSVTLLIACASFGQEKNAIIKGQLSDTINAVLNYGYETKDGYKADSVKITKGCFEITEALESPAMIVLIRQTNPVPGMSRVQQYYAMDVRNVFVEGGRVIIVGPDLKQAKVSGEGKSQKDLESLERSQKNIEDEQQRIRLAYEKAEVLGDSVEMKGLIKADRESMVAIEEIENAFVKEHPDSYISLYIINRRIRMRKESEAKKMMAGLSKSLLATPSASMTAKKLDNIFKLEVGNVAPDFMQADPEGKLVSLSSFRGRFVLIDFWASWCVPCRAENPNIVAAYKKYKDKGFEILGVSLDSDKQKWLKAVSDDGLTWTQLSDLKGWQNQVAKQYEVSGVPFNLLVDPAGVIVAKELRGEALIKKLDLILSSQSSPTMIKRQS